ncbi:MAG: DUF4169 domain-containing protein [Dehalococcoidia bacterium]|nr:DUF4169 domain-containing protein [Dehalococcoidia bacterium]
MDRWQQRAKKLEARRQRIAKHGRSLLTAVRAAETRRAEAARRSRAPSEGEARHGQRL